jgi:PhnB protein
MVIEPYLNFNGRSEEAAEFYRDALGARIEALIRFSDSPEPPPPGMIPPGSEGKVMHMALRIGGSLLLGSDGSCTGGAVFQGTSLSLATDGDEQAERLFAALAEGGSVQMPIGPSFFSSRFGMVTDKFGVPWMLSVAAPS